MLVRKNWCLEAAAEQVPLTGARGGEKKNDQERRGRRIISEKGQYEILKFRGMGENDGFTTRISKKYKAVFR